jgi:F-type H+-transporting ATPase subunit delta
MNQGKVGGRYAQALFELGEESGKLEELVAAISRFADAYDTSRELRRDLSNPTIPAAEREAVLRALATRLAVPDLALRGLLLIAKRRRLTALPEIARRLTALSDEKSGILRGHVVTAAPMSEEYFTGLSESIGRTTNKRVLLTHAVDDTLIGGAILRVGDATIDVSIRGRLGEMQRSLLQAFARAS